ncbi:TonB system transport protein ExbD [Pseudothioclava nitratireducens]|uniref:TonB system transport protein ExbD n=1 Tax=Pseudothioclava nitratireducens TaxID=1928646 RepID=UPI0023DC496C|nr:TonB system transport protein ExbD [Defluviimonas nitratireducens]MDF1620150.1 TonB system transport protein ExbD [Defluviimonas nitratireducens]
MGFSLYTDDSPEEMSEINVTPFIDVMLVLLIIFMVAAPLATVDIPVDLPGQSAAPATPRDAEPLFLTLTGEQRLMLNEQPVAPGALAAALEVATGADPETRLYLRADESVPYGALMAVMDELRGAGYLKVALVTREIQGGAP